jgi:hypothetical protein
VHISKSYFTEKAVLHRYLPVTAYIFVWWVKLAPQNRKNKKIKCVCASIRGFRQWRTWRLDRRHVVCVHRGRKRAGRVGFFTGWLVQNQGETRSQNEKCNDVSVRTLLGICARFLPVFSGCSCTREKAASTPYRNIWPHMPVLDARATVHIFCAGETTSKIRIRKRVCYSVILPTCLPRFSCYLPLFSPPKKTAEVPLWYTRVIWWITGGE